MRAGAGTSCSFTAVAIVQPVTAAQQWSGRWWLLVEGQQVSGAALHQHGQIGTDTRVPELLVRRCHGGLHQADGQSGVCLHQSLDDKADDEIILGLRSHAPQPSAGNDSPQFHGAAVSPEADLAPACTWPDPDPEPPVVCTPLRAGTPAPASNRTSGPEQSHHKAARRKRGSGGGRPAGLDRYDMAMAMAVSG